jgi:hypothetical protein
MLLSTVGTRPSTHFVVPPTQEMLALRESLRVHADGTLPDTSSVLVKMDKTRERSLPGGIGADTVAPLSPDMMGDQLMSQCVLAVRTGAPRGVVLEYAIDLLIQAPGEDVHVVRCESGP